MSESNEEEVAEEFKHFFHGARFKFEGLTSETEEEFVKLIKEMGGEVSNNAEITFMQKSYFEKKKIGTKGLLCDVDWIVDSVQKGERLELYGYLLTPDDEQLSDDEPLCYTARYMYKTDSCQECYYTKVFCKECAKESIKESVSAANQNNIVSATDSSFEDEIMNSPDQKAMNRSDKSSKRLMSSDSEQDSNDKEQTNSSCAGKSPVKKKLKNSRSTDNTYNKPSKRLMSSDSEQDSNDKEQTNSSCAEKSPVQKKLKNSRSTDNTYNKPSKRLMSSDSEQDSNDKEQTNSSCAKKSPIKKKLENSPSTDNTFKREESPDIDVENYTEMNYSQSHGNSVNNFQNKQVEKATNGISRTAHDSIEPRVLQSRKSDVAETKEDDSLSDDSSDNEFSTKNGKKKTSPQKAKTASNSGWISSSKPKLTIKTEPEPALYEPEPLPNSLFNIIDEDDEEANYFKGDKWWLPQDVPENDKCTVRSCSFEPTDHPRHYPFKKFLSLIEKKILVKYLIIKNVIHSAKGKKVFQNMIIDGYLTHRSWETLRNCFRRTILKEIESYKLDQGLLNQFLIVRLKNVTKVKEEK